jgi:hypothetical protein
VFTYYQPSRAAFVHADRVGLLRFCLIGRDLGAMSKVCFPGTQLPKETKYWSNCYLSL